MKKWWEKEPLRFECQPDCFKCCIKPGIVRFDCEDIRKAAAYLDFSIAEFKKPEVLTIQTKRSPFWTPFTKRGTLIVKKGLYCSYDSRTIS